MNPQILGWTATILFTACYIPQIAKTLKTKTTDMNYELVKQLKDAGFPQRLDLNDALSWEDFAEHKEDARPIVQYLQGVGIHLMYDSSRGESMEELRGKPVSEWDGKGRPSYYFKREYVQSQEGQELLAYRPTLEELIEACGDIIRLQTYFDHNDLMWQADNSGNFFIKDSKEMVAEVGSTPTEAVARLYLALKKKI